MTRLVRLLEHRRLLAEPMASAAGHWSERRALLVVLDDGRGHVGLGEAAPLPGYSSDSLDEARHALRALNGTVPADLTRVAVPSARAALEAARLDLLARVTEKPAWAVQPAAGSTSLVRPPAPLPLSLWLPDGLDPALAAADAALERGIACFKVKLRPDSMLGLTTLQALRKRFGDTVHLRADANAAFPPDALAPLLPALRALALEWLEEPTSEPLTASLGLPVALDESLRLRTPGTFVREKALGLAALVLKPMTLGGMSPVVELYRDAAADGIACVASHTLEGPVGFMMAATVALRFGCRFAHGLGPHPGLGGVRPPALHATRDELVAWAAPGFGLDLEMALAGAEVLGEEHY